ncbi:MAG: recombinase family protein [Lachnospiraceae bacterium]|nr:recombinase family protein [Lachnospiraceae bacterium]
MARKSRKQDNAQIKEKTSARAGYKAAIYARLSAEREDTLERGTIDNQVDFVRNYIEKQEDMDTADVYVDDVFSGTNFERPGFNRMMADMRAGKINAIVVKDLSRLGRDYLETGNLIERVFPMFGVRFVAILDGFDSAKSAAELMVSVTNIANALYAQDISKKVYSSMHGRMEKGIPVGVMPYGYRAVKGSDNIRQMVIDGEPASVIRRIADYILAGKRAGEIASILNSEGVPTPYQYRYRNQPEKLALKPYLKWNGELISALMRNEVYTGKYVMGKDTACLYRHEKRRTTDRAEWMVFEDHHEAIISSTEFEQIRKMRPCNKTCRAKGEVNLFKGKIVCGKCGSAVTEWSDHHKTRFYVCVRKKRYGKNSCDCNNVSKPVVYDMVRDVLKEEMQMLLEQDAVIKALSRSGHVQEKKRMFMEAVNKCMEESGRLRERKGNLYRDFQDGLLNEGEYISLNREYTEQYDKLAQMAEDYEKMIQRLEADPLEAGNVKELIGKYVRSKKLTQEMVDALVSKVIVHEGKRLEVVLTFEDAKAELLRKRAEMEG